MAAEVLLDDRRTHRRASLPPPWVLVVAGVALFAGVALRAWILANQVSPTESDEAVLGLIALRLTRGDVHLMYWGQPYGGPVESFLAAPLLAVFGPSVLATKLVGAGLSLASAVVIWRIGRRTVGPTAGVLAAALFWVWPPYFVFYSTKMSIYFGALFLSVLTALLVIRIAQGDASRWSAPVAGVVAGLAFWASPQTLFLLLPLAAALLPQLLRRWRTSLATAPFVLVGAAPWLVHNARNDWVSLGSVPVDQHVSYVDRVLGVAPQIPLALGLRTFGTERWLHRPLATVVLVVLAIGLAWVVVRRPHRWWFLGVATLLFPLAYAMSPLSVYSKGGSPRYFLMALPLVTLLLGRALAAGAGRWHPAIAVVGLLAALTVTVLGLDDLADHRLGWFPGAPDVLVPPDFADLRHLLDEREVDHAYADYWVSFRATFEVGERTIVAPVQPWLDRYPPYSETVAAAAAPAYITLADSAVTERVQRDLEAAGVPFRATSRGAFVLIEPASAVSRETLVPAYQLQP